MTIYDSIPTYRKRTVEIACAGLPDRVTLLVVNCAWSIGRDSITAPSTLAGVQTVVLVDAVAIITLFTRVEQAIPAPQSRGHAIRTATISIDVITIVTHFSLGAIQVAVATGLVRSTVRAATISTKGVAVVALLSFGGIHITVATDLS
jgi:hypothetical protein